MVTRDRLTSDLRSWMIGLLPRLSPRPKLGPIRLRSDARSLTPEVRLPPSHPPVIGTPVLDCLLDLGPRHFFVHRAFGQFRKFGVRCEAQPAQLTFSQLRNAGTQRLLQQPHQSQLLFQAN